MAKLWQPLYNFVVVIDDIDMGISNVIRGEDHIGNTPKQILLYEALGARVPEFGHSPLILNQSGQKLSKRDGVTSISDFRDLGYVPEALANYMTLLGWSPPEPMTERFTLAEAAEKFSFERVNKAGAKFDWDKLNWLNSQVLHELAPSDLTDRLLPFWQDAIAAAEPAIDPEADRAWLEELAALIGPSLVTLKDAGSESRFFFTHLVTLDESALQQIRQQNAPGVLQAMLERRAELKDLTAEQAKRVLNEMTKAQGIKKGLVMRTLRAALMGTMQGPDMLQSWLLLNQRGWDIDRFEEALTLI
jgi:glutamyl-tRNA synthetase